ncbi:response regulator [Rubrolithibacter danxiaensis]|uniref:response regulator n=1 Tax=Rubrolithibacter danxiaensis TaxID=3390805 RepID=UPI003BF8F085
MKRNFKSLPLPVKLMIIGFLPLVFLLLFGIKIHQEKQERLHTLENFRNRIFESSEIMKLIAELQKERRFSFSYALRKQNKGSLINQRTKTDSALLALDTFSTPSVKNFQSYTFIDSLGSVRKQIDRGSLDPQQITNYYTNTIFRLNTLTPVSLQNIAKSDSIYKEMQSQKLLSEMITYLGLLRASIYSVLFYQGNQMNPAATDQLNSIYGIYNSFYREFSVKGSEQAISTYQKARENSDLKPTLDFIESYIKNDGIDKTYTPDEFWDISGSGVAQLDRLLITLTSEVNKKVSELYEAEKMDMYKNLALVTGIIILVIIIVFYTIRTISQSLSQLRWAAEKLAVGSTGIDLSISSNDVIGSLAESVLVIDRNNNQLAKAAEAIGHGKMDVEIVPRTEDDVIGHAILQMKKDLQQFRQENKEKIWVQTGVALIVTSLQGEKTLDTLSKDSLNALVNYLEVEVGLFFISNEEKLHYYNGYAVADKKSIPTVIPFGETLVGQAAVNKEIIYLKDTPADFVKIATASGSANPNHVLIVPLVYNGILKGVIELGSFKPFSEAALHLTKEVSNNIAVALNTAKNRAKLQELFEETQAQSEELQAQHGELENINTELEAQTHKLQASEEELKVQQEELLQANKELEERARLLEDKNQVIVERNLEIQKKAEELELSTKYKSEFLANMSHELRTPLNSILLLSRLMGENTENNLSEDQIEYAKVIQSSGNGLLTLIDEILDLSKIESGKMDLEYSPVFADELVRDLQSMFAPLAREKNLELLFNISPDVPSISTDRLRLEQILKNLLSNSLKFTSKGSIKFHISVPEDKSSYIAFSVKDTGIGIAKEKQKQIFEAFQQADGTTRRKYGGTGLGLSISKELAKLLGGEIKLISELGSGSEFIVTIPQYPIPNKKEISEDKIDIRKEIDDKPEAATSSPEERPRFITSVIPNELDDDRNSINPQDKYILIVEDDTLFAKALLEFTRKKGYKGIVAVRGDSGIELAKQYKPKAILLDIQLPVKDGWEVMEELKASKETRHIPVHIMSSMEVKKESLLKGAIDFINKPLAVEQMQKVFYKLEEALSKGSRKVLIIEENPKHAKALAYFLETFKINSTITETIRDGVNALQKKEVDCVILDMGIPDKNAYETLETVKENPGLENIPIIIFTGKNLSKNEEGKLKQYADSIVLKTAHSYQRILDEVGLFLHVVEEKQTDQTQTAPSSRLGVLSEVLKNKTVLVADDDVRNIFSITKALEQLKMKVISAVDGKEALKILEENQEVDIVLMDMMMPEMDGYETTAKIRQNYRFKNLPVIAVTAKAMIGDREKCIQAGASDYISKPIDIDQLISLLRVWLYDRTI